MLVPILPMRCDVTQCPLLFNTGTRIIYDRKFLMHIRQSPLAKSPPANLPKIPGVTVPSENRPDGHPEPIEELAKKGTSAHIFSFDYV